MSYNLLFMTLLFNLQCCFERRLFLVSLDIKTHRCNMRKVGIYLTGKSRSVVCKIKFQNTRFSVHTVVL